MREDLLRADKVIDLFVGEHEFLSNFYPCHVEYGGLSFICAEGAYQAQKAVNPKNKPQFTCLYGGQSKRKGRKVWMRSDWDNVKYSIMKDIVTFKFLNNPPLMRQLLNTFPSELIEGNTWKDTFWGYDFNLEAGENNLGKILMEIRNNPTRGLTKYSF